MLPKAEESGFSWAQSARTFFDGGRSSRGLSLPAFDQQESAGEVFSCLGIHVCRQVGQRPRGI
jgi:hypothetical protein